MKLLYLIGVPALFGFTIDSIALSAEPSRPKSSPEAVAEQFWESMLSVKIAPTDAPSGSKEWEKHWEQILVTPPQVHAEFTDMLKGYGQEEIRRAAKKYVSHFGSKDVAAPAINDFRFMISGLSTFTPNGNIHSHPNEHSSVVDKATHTRVDATTH